MSLQKTTRTTGRMGWFAAAVDDGKLSAQTFRKYCNGNINRLEQTDIRPKWTWKHVLDTERTRAAINLNSFSSEISIRFYEIRQLFIDGNDC